MSDAHVRADVLTAMSESPYVEHKLRLDEFVITPRGKRLAALAGRTLGTDVSGFAAAVGSLPKLDFYVPRRSDRTTWSGKDNVVVSAVMAEDQAPSQAYSVRGETLSYDLKGSGTIAFLLAPAEARNYRFDARSTGGTTIQHPDEQPGGGVIRRFDRYGKLIEEVQLAELRQRTGGADFSLLAASGPIDTMFLGSFYTDADDGVGTMEIEFRAWYYDGSGNLRESHEVEIDEIETNFRYRWNRPLLFRRATDSTAEYVRLKIVETDVGSDDDMGTREYYWGDNGVEYTHQGSGDNSNVILRWTPKPKPVAGNVVHIVGPAYIKPSRQCTWSLDTDVDSPTIEWRVGTSVIGNSHDVTYTASGNFDLEVQVWNLATGEWAGTTKSINVSTANGDCNAQ